MPVSVVCWQSILRATGVTITDPGTDTGFDHLDMADLHAWSVWKSSVTTSPINIDIDLGASGALDADYVAIVNSNLLTLGATVEVFADTFTPPTTSRLAAHTPDSDSVHFKALTAPGALRYWRVRIAHAAPPFAAKPFIGELFVGLKTTLPENVAPSFDPFFDDVDAVGEADTEEGNYLGAVLRGHRHRDELTFGQGGAARAAYTASLNAFIAHAQKRQPFVFVLDPGDTDFKVARYVRVPDDGRIRRLAVGGSWGRLTLNLPLREALMEPA